MSDLTNNPKKPILKKWWFWGIIAVILIAIFASLGKKDNSSTTAITNNKTETTQPETKEEAKPATKTFGINDEIKFKDSQWVVLSAKKTKILKSNNPYQEDKTNEGYFVIIEYKVTNLQNKEDQILESPSLIDGKGTEYKIDRDFWSKAIFYLPKDAKSITMEQLKPNLPKKFYGIYEVPNEAKNLKFQARELKSFGDKTPIELGL